MSATFLGRHHRGRHPLDRHPLGRHPPAHCRLGYTHPLPSACWDTPPSAQCMLGYRQQVGGNRQTPPGRQPPLAGARLCFTRVCNSIQGGVIPAYLAGYQAHSQGELEGLRGLARSTPRGKVEGSGWGGLQAHTQGSPWAHTRGVPGPHWGLYPSMHWDRPPSRRLLLLAVHILLECILVFFKFKEMSSFCEAVDTVGLDLVTHFFGYVQWIP